MTGIHTATSVSMDDVWEFCHRNLWSQDLISEELLGLQHWNKSLHGSIEERACGILKGIPVFVSELTSVPSGLKLTALEQNLVTQ